MASLRTFAIAALVALGSGLIAFALLQLITSPPAWVTSTAIELTAVEVSAAPPLTGIIDTDQANAATDGHEHIRLRSP
ncbi:MAG TPA: hypothetical protein VFR17_14330 [Mycobacterium sp.]|nr:hypothetical protein [Mycobacterium sp.]